MTEPDPATEAGGTAVANVENVPLESTDASGKIECEQKVQIDENKAQEEKDTMEKEEGIDKEDVKKSDGAIENNEDNKKVEVEDGHESKEGEVEVGDDKKEGKFEENGDKKKQVESKDDEEKKDRHQNGLRALEDIEERKEDIQNVDTGETEGLKMLGAEDVKTGEPEDVNMINSDDVKIFDEECVKGEKGSEEKEIGPNRTDDVSKGGNDGTTSVKVDIDREVDKLKKKRSRTTKASQNVGKDRKEAETKSMQLLQSPLSSIDRPVRERKTVERLVEVIEKEANREFQVEKGRGTPLKDIPNVAYKLARKKPADIKLIHQTLFGRKGKAINFKSHILQFSGFVWHESDEKQRAKMKEKLDKYVKDALLDLCDLFDLPVSRANSRKEDLVVKLLDFLVAPQPTTDVIPAEGQKSRKRKRMSRDGSLKSGRSEISKLSKKRTEHEDSPTGKDSSTQETEDEELKDVKQNDLHEQEKEDTDSENEENESESEKSADEDEYNEKKLSEGNRGKKRAGKQRGSISKEKLKVVTSPKKSERLSSKRIKAEEDARVNVLSRNKNMDSPKKRSTPKSNSKEIGADKQIGRGKTIPVEVEQPSKEDLRKKVCEILNEVDFNKATFTDILKQLAAYYKMDMTPKKASLKVMIEEELTKLADTEEADKGNDEKARKPKSKGKYVKA